jgi:hypothetical protein
MRTQTLSAKALTAALGLLSAISLLTGRPAGGHCDTLDGPVVKDAKAALEKGDVTPVLKWVAKADEEEIRVAFKKALAVRSKGPEAKELADQFFFETLVRVHRAAEGAPFTGLKPAGTDLGPAVSAADKALQDGKIDAVVDLVTKDVAAGIRERFAVVMEKKKHADESVEAGREYVAAYVAYVHYVEGIHAVATGGHHEGNSEGGPAGSLHEHHEPKAESKAEHHQH